MPYISVSTAMHISESRMTVLQREIGAIIAQIPGKNIDNCMTHITGDCRMFMGDAPAKSVFCQVQVFGAAPREEKAQVFQSLDELFQRELGAEKIYINFLEFSEWGSGHEYKSK